jgi:hypothetical protein
MWWRSLLSNGRSTIREAPRPHRAVGYSSGGATPSGFGKTRGQNPHELRGRGCPHLRPDVRQVVLARRVRQAQAVGGGLLRPGSQYGCDHADFTLDRAFGGAARTAEASCAADQVARLGRLGEAHRDWKVVGLGAKPLARPETSVPCIRAHGRPRQTSSRRAMSHRRNSMSPRGPNSTRLGAFTQHICVPTISLNGCLREGGGS